MSSSNINKNNTSKYNISSEFSKAFEKELKTHINNKVYGLKSAPINFCNIVESELVKCEKSRVIVYVDDLIIIKK